MHLYAKLASAVVAQRRERQSRMMTMEAMSAAIEHELRQPLAAIVANAGAARRWLARSPPDTVEAGQSVEQIEEEGQRAANILASVRRLFAAQDAPAAEPLDARAPGFVRDRRAAPARPAHAAPGRERAATA
jgi:C4-dicarboxylate-specific signal transduction histidine kinase